MTAVSPLVSAVLVGGLILALTHPEPRLRVGRAWNPRSEFRWALGFVGVEVGAWVGHSPTLGMAVPTVLVLAHRATLRMRVKSHRQRMKSALPAFADELAQQLRSGGSLTGSLFRVAHASPQMKQELAGVLSAMAAGERLEVALQKVEPNDEAVRLVLVTIGLLATTGGPAAETVERMGENVRAVIASEEEAKALAGQGTASAFVLGVLPLVFAVLAAFGDSQIARFYVFEWLGAACVTVSILLTGASWFWMETLMGPSDR